MKYTDVVSNVNVYGMESAVMGSKYPMAVDLTKVDGTIVPRTHALANAKPGSELSCSSTSHLQTRHGWKRNDITS